MSYRAKTEKQTLWLKRLQEAESSELSLADYARANDLSVQSLYQWRSTLKANSSSASPRTRHFTQVVTTAPAGLIVEINNARLRFSQLPDSAWLRSLLHAQDDNL